MGKIGIKGNSACGEKIIKFLTRLGGVNVHNLTGYDDTRVYYIDIAFSHIGYVNIEYYDGIWYSYVDFMEKFPFVIGDRVVNKADGRDGIVYSMMWDCDSGEVVYNVSFGEGVSADFFVIGLSYPSVNTTNETKHLQLTTYTEPIIEENIDDITHRTFRNLFVSSEFDKDTKSLIMCRKNNSKKTRFYFISKFRHDFSPFKYFS